MEKYLLGPILYQSDSCREPFHILENGGGSEIKEDTTCTFGCEGGVSLSTFDLLLEGGVSLLRNVNKRIE